MVELEYRPYQHVAIRAALDNYVPGEKPRLIVSATGTGKTVIATGIAKEVAPLGPVLMMVHRETLVEQTRAKFRAMGFRVFVEKADSKAWEILDEIQGAVARGPVLVVASVQTLHRRRLENWPVDFFARIIIDEAHHATAPSWRRIFEHFECPVTGITATARRKALGNIFDFAFRMGLKEAIDQGWLTPLEFVPEIIESWDLSKLKKPNRHLWACRAGHEHTLVEREEMTCPVVDCGGAMEMIAAASVSSAEFAAIIEEEGEERVVPAIKKGVLKHIGNRKGLFFAPSVLVAKVFTDWIDTNTEIVSTYVCDKTPKKHCAPRCAECRMTMDVISVARVMADMFSSETLAPDVIEKIVGGGGDEALHCKNCDVVETDVLARCPCRKCILERYAAGIIGFLGNFGVLTEGFDDQDTSLIVLARALTKNIDLYEQIVGRGARPHSSIARLLNDALDADARKKLIADSPKPVCRIVDLQGVRPGFRLITPFDLIKGSLAAIPEEDFEGLLQGDTPLSLDDLAGIVAERAEEIAAEQRAEEARKEKLDRDFAARQARLKKQRELAMQSDVESTSLEVDYFLGSAPTFPVEFDKRPSGVKARHDARGIVGEEEPATSKQRAFLRTLHRRVLRGYEPGLRYSQEMDKITPYWSKSGATAEIDYLQDALEARGRWKKKK